MSEPQPLQLKGKRVTGTSGARGREKRGHMGQAPSTHLCTDHARTFPGQSGDGASSCQAPGLGTQPAEQSTQVTHFSQLVRWERSLPLLSGRAESHGDAAGLLRSQDTDSGLPEAKPASLCTLCLLAITPRASGALGQTQVAVSSVFSPHVRAHLKGIWEEGLGQAEMTPDC